MYIYIYIHIDISSYASYRIVSRCLLCLIDAPKEIHAMSPCIGSSANSADSTRWKVTRVVLWMSRFRSRGIC